MAVTVGPLSFPPDFHPLPYTHIPSALRGREYTSYLDQCDTSQEHIHGTENDPSSKCALKSLLYQML
jgi:hypothetical protein